MHVSLYILWDNDVHIFNGGLLEGERGGEFYTLFCYHFLRFLLKYIFLYLFYLYIEMDGYWSNYYNQRVLFEIVNLDYILILSSFYWLCLVCSQYFISVSSFYCVISFLVVNGINNNKVSRYTCNNHNNNK